MPLNWLERKGLKILQELDSDSVIIVVVKSFCGSASTFHSKGEQIGISITYGER